ncbi:hypothetical protein CP02DC14_0845B, partial [Chlamydia psittaci 02DC14]
IRILL